MHTDELIEIEVAKDKQVVSFVGKGKMYFAKKYRQAIKTGTPNLGGEPVGYPCISIITRSQHMWNPWH